MICRNCGKEFVVQQKGVGGGNRIFCYECMPYSTNRSTRYRQRYDLLVEYSNRLKLERGCDICGYNKCAKALEWHHPNSNKDKNPANLLHYSLDKYLNEIKKCVLLCSNCHREIHSKDERRG